MCFNYTDSNSSSLKEHTIRAIVKSYLTSEPCGFGWSMSRSEADQAANIEVYCATHNMDKIQCKPDHVMMHYRMLCGEYYNVMMTNARFTESFNFKMDAKCGFKQPSYGELVWHAYGTDAADLLDDINPIYELVYDCRRRAHSVARFHCEEGKVDIKQAYSLKHFKITDIEAHNVVLNMLS